MDTDDDTSGVGGETSDASLAHYRQHPHTNGMKKHKMHRKKRSTKKSRSGGSNSRSRLGDESDSRHHTKVKEVADTLNRWQRVLAAQPE